MADASKIEFIGPGPFDLPLMQRGAAASEGENVNVTLYVSARKGRRASAGRHDSPRSIFSWREAAKGRDTG